MEFNSLTFICIYLPIFLLLFNVSNSNNYKNIIILIFSFLFYLLGDVSHFLLLLFVIIMTYSFGRIVKKHKSSYYVYLILIIALLCFFKYGNYLLDSINMLFINHKIESIIMPLGISFYVFTSISYVSDVYYEKYEPDNNILNIAMFISFFPTVISGPILRFDSFREYIINKETNKDNVSSGLRRFVVGLGKKIIIANQLAIVCDTIINKDIKINFLLSCFALLSYALQLFSYP